MMREDPAPGSVGKRKWWALVALALAGIAVSLDLTVLNLALPVIARSLHASTGDLEWVLDGYALVLSVLTLPAGLLGDRYGRKLFLCIALVIFGVSSLLCAQSHSIGLLIASRVALGVGAAFILPLALSVVPVFFDEKERPKAIALLLGGVFVAYPLGPILGGFLLTHYAWGSVFVINLPIVALAFLCVLWLLPESKSGERHRLDLSGVSLSGLGLLGITYGAIEAETNGWGNVPDLSLIASGFLVLGAFWFHEQKRIRSGNDPLIDLALFRKRAFSWGTLLMTSVNFSLFGLLFTFPQYLQDVLGETSQGAGYHLLPLIAGLMVGAVAMAKAAAAIPARAIVSAGFAVMAVGLVIGTGTTVHSGNGFLIIWIALTGLGLGVAMPAAANAALGTLSPERSGVGNAAITAIRQVGGTLGVAVLGSLLGSIYQGDLALPHLPPALARGAKEGITQGLAIASRAHLPALALEVDHAFVKGMDAMLWVSAVIAAAASVLALAFLPGKGEEKTDHPV